MTSRILVTLVCISGFLDLFGVAMIYPQLVHRAKELGASPKEIGLFGSIYGTLQFFASPLMGQLSDHIGRRNVLMLALLGTSISYFLLGAAESVLFLGLARIPSGMFKFSQAMSKAYVSDIVSPHELPGLYGKFNSISSIGFVIGPTIAGWLMMSEGGFQYVANLSASIFLFNAFFNHFIISYVADIETAGEECKKKEDGEHQRGFSLFAAFNAFKDIRKVPWHLIWDAFLIRFFMSFSLMIYRANFTSVLTFVFDTDPLTNGYIQSFNGVVSMATGWLIASIKLAFTSNNNMHDTFAVLLVMSLFVLTVTPSLVIYVIGIIPLCVASSILRVTNATAIIHRGGEEARGLVLGLADTMTALARAFAPALAGYALETSYMAPGFCSIFAAIIGTSIGFYSSRFSSKHSKVD